jgi:hypothetical protein
MLAHYSASYKIPPWEIDEYTPDQIVRIRAIYETITFNPNWEPLADLMALVTVAAGGKRSKTIDWMPVDKKWMKPDRKNKVDDDDDGDDDDCDLAGLDAFADAIAEHSTK